MKWQNGKNYPKPVSTIPVVGKYWCYWYTLGNGRLIYFIILEEIVSTIRNNGVYVGEQDSHELGECLLEPATRNVQQITVKDVIETEKLFETFMGPSTQPRKEYILKYSEEANDVY